MNPKNAVMLLAAAMAVPAFAEPVSKDDFLLASIQVREGEDGVYRANLEECNNGANEKVGALRFLVKRYDMEVNGMAVIFASAGQLNLNTINNFQQLKQAVQTGKIQKDDYELFEAPNLDSVISGVNKRVYAPDYSSPVLDVEKSTLKTKCVRKILFKGDTESAGQPDVNKESQILVFGAKSRAEVNSITSEEAQVPMLQERVENLRRKVGEARELVRETRAAAVDASARADMALEKLND